ncbi:MGH1-like glycoside hydrolase domain-containing protein [Rhizocola hellebori]|nr:hypothetical protein [Rhizocola hellebori]
MSLHSGHALYDSAYAKATRDVQGNIVDGKLLAGRRWASVWTRDSSYAIDLGTGLGVPEIAKTTMRTKTSTDPLGEVWHQDSCRHFGGWPNLTDAIVGAVGAWSTYLASGDEEFLRWSYQVTGNSLARAERDAFDAGSGLFRGCSSFMESNSGYPFRFHSNGARVRRTKALSTNLLYHRGYTLAARMAEIFGEDPQPFADKARRLQESINLRLWVPAKGLYAYYENEHGRPSSRAEGLGAALAVLWGVADDERATQIFKNTHITGHGLPCLWPRYLAWLWHFNDANYYHNGMVWPFVQAYWARAAAARGQTAIFGNELAHLANLAGRATTFHEFYRPFTGKPDGSARQLWSAAGYLSMIHQGLFGMSFDTTGITFRPVRPAIFQRVVLRGFRYREMELNLEIDGVGDQMVSFAFDGHLHEPVIPLNLTGIHKVSILMGV